ncbi:hypothetical protein X743_30035 [Mesorhizobium sp. LNHC252B00]|nr:hypothetical protein X743_30035 [Mesorhizobium sp. LNHC252B00]
MDVEIADEPANDVQLLEILLAEEGEIGTRLQKELDDGCHASKWPGQNAPHRPSLTPPADTMVANPSG